MTVNSKGQLDQDLHHDSRCTFNASRPEPGHGGDRRDDSIADNVGTTRRQSEGLAEAR